MPLRLIILCMFKLSLCAIHQNSSFSSNIYNSQTLHYAFLFHRNKVSLFMSKVNPFYTYPRSHSIYLFFLDLMIYQKRKNQDQSSLLSYKHALNFLIKKTSLFDNFSQYHLISLCSSIIILLFSMLSFLSFFLFVCFQD